MRRSEWGILDWRYSVTSQGLTIADALGFWRRFWRRYRRRVWARPEQRASRRHLAAMLAHTLADKIEWDELMESLKPVSPRLFVELMRCSPFSYDFFPYHVPRLCSDRVMVGQLPSLECFRSFTGGGAGPDACAASPDGPVPPKDISEASPCGVSESACALLAGLVTPPVLVDSSPGAAEARDGSPADREPAQAAAPTFEMDDLGERGENIPLNPPSKGEFKSEICGSTEFTEADGADLNSKG